jgi:hypothetical protein
VPRRHACHLLEVGALAHVLRLFHRSRVHIEINCNFDLFIVAVSNFQVNDDVDGSPSDGAIGSSPALTPPIFSEDTGDSTPAGIQYMITNKMRRILEDDLGYLSEEVDIMEPQIAVVVIDKRLMRPPNGMPSSWAKDSAGSTAVSRRTSNGGGWGLTSPIRGIGSAGRRLGRRFSSMLSPLHGPVQAVKQFSWSVVRTGMQWAPVLVPVVTAAYVTPYILNQLDDPDSVASTIYDGVCSACSSALSCLPRFGRQASSRHRHDRNPQERIDMRTLNVVRKWTWRDQLASWFSSSE